MSTSTKLNGRGYIFPCSSATGEGKALSESNIRDITTSIASRNYKLSDEDLKLSILAGSGSAIHMDSGIAIINGYRVIYIADESESIAIPSDVINSDKTKWDINLRLPVQTSANNTYVIGDKDGINAYLYFSEYSDDSIDYTVDDISKYTNKFLKNRSDENVDKADSFIADRSEFSYNKEVQSNNASNYNAIKDIARAYETCTPISNKIWSESLPSTCVKNQILDSNGIATMSLKLGYMIMDPSTGLIIEIHNYNCTDRVDIGQIFTGEDSIDKFLLRSGNFVKTYGGNCIYGQPLDNPDSDESEGRKPYLSTLDVVRTEEASGRDTIPIYYQSSTFLGTGYNIQTENTSDGNSDDPEEAVMSCCFRKSYLDTEYVNNNGNIFDYLADISCIKHSTKFNECSSEYYINRRSIVNDAEGSGYNNDKSIYSSYKIGYYELDSFDESEKNIRFGIFRNKLDTKSTNIIDNGKDNSRILFTPIEDIINESKSQSGEAAGLVTIASDIIELLTDKDTSSKAELSENGFLYEKSGTGETQVVGFSTCTDSESNPNTSLSFKNIVTDENGNETTKQANMYYDPVHERVEMDSDFNVQGYITATRVYNAVYNDIAEFMEKSDNSAPIEAGDALCVEEDGTVKKIETESDLERLIGICSSDRTYGYILGGTDIDDDKKVPLGLAGRVYAKTDDTNIKAGNKLSATKDGKVTRTNSGNRDYVVGIAMGIPEDGYIWMLIK